MALKNSSSFRGHIYIYVYIYCELHSDDVVLLPLSGSNHLIQLSYLGDHSAQEGPGCGGCGTCGLVEP